MFENPKSEATLRLAASALKNVCALETDREFNDKEVLLRVASVSKRFTKCEGDVLQDISLSLHKGETVGLVGESGCGKSTLARMIARIIKPSLGSILYKDNNIYKNNRYPELVQMIFQDPFLSLDPHMMVNDIILEGARRKKHFTKKEAIEMVGTYLEMVGLDFALGTRYPHQLSGGQCQRVSIARALTMNPELIVCDEPTSSLDTVSQAQILDLFKRLKREKGMGYLFISHDIRLLSNICDRIAVMHNGKIIESGKCNEVLSSSAQPYTKLLIQATYGCAST